jgi:DNA transposition AAA+ family ATPase
MRALASIPQEQEPKASRGKPISARETVAAMVEADVSLTRIAIECGVPAADISAWLDGASLTQANDARIAAWLEDLDRAATPDRTVDELPWVDTPTSQRICQVFEQARLTPSIGLVYGVPGASKTTTALRYAKTAKLKNEARILYVASTPYTRTATGILFRLSHALPGNHYPNSRARAYKGYALAQTILRFLTPGSLILVDEAQFLDVPALDALRSFYDEAGIGVVMIGNEIIYTRIAGKSRRAEFAQLHSRVGMRLQITAPDGRDIDAVMQAWGIKGAAERQLLLDIGAGPGGLRQLANVVRQARMGARHMKRPLDAQLLRGVAALLGID